MAGFDLALQEQKLTALREQLALKHTQISGLWAENAELHAALSKSNAELDEWRFTNKIDEMQREIERLSTHVVKSQPVEQGEPYAYANGFGDLFKNRDEIEGVATELFTHPVRPMSDEQIAQWMPVGLLRTEEFVYQKGIKDAEKFHGIKGATE